MLLLLAVFLSATSTNDFPYSKGVAVQGIAADGGNIQAYGFICSGAMSCTGSQWGWVTLNASGSSDGGGAGAPTNASYITEVAESGLSNEFAMASLGTGLVKNTTTTGVPSIYAGTSCTNQFPRSLNASGAATCASVALAADVSGTLPQGNGGTGAGTLTCTSGQALFSNGSAYSCTSTLTASDVACASTCVSDAEIAAVAASKLTGTVAVANGGTGAAPAGDDQVLVSDSSSAATWRTLTNCTDTGGNHVNYTASTNSWSCGTSQLHDVGGSSPQVQYNNGGAFGGLADVEGDGTHMLRVGVSSHPSSPGTIGRAVHYDLSFDAGGGPFEPFERDTYFGVPVPIGSQNPFALFGSNAQWRWMCCGHDFSGGTGLWTTGGVSTTTGCASTGGNSTPAWATTNIRTRQPTLNLVTATGNNSVANVRQGVLTMWRGNTSGAGGFKFWSRFGIQDDRSGHQLFVGLANQVTAVGNPPSNTTDAVYVGCDSGQTTLRVCSNDNSGAATCTDLGSNFPSNTINALYDVWISAAANASSIEVLVERLDSSFVSYNVLTSDLPRNTVQLAFQTDMCNGGTGVALGDAGHLDWVGSCASWNL